MNYDLNKYTIVEKDVSESDADFHKTVKKQALLSPHYQHLSKRIYRKIDGYIAPIRIFKDITTHLYATEMGVLNIGYNLQIPPQQVLEEYYAGDTVSAAAFAYSYDWTYGNYIYK